MIVVGVDVHKRSLTAVAVDQAGRALAQLTAGSCGRDEPAVNSANARPASSTATAVSDCLCTSTPTTIIQIASSNAGATGERTGLNRGEATLLSGHTRPPREGGGDTTLARRQTIDIRESSQPPPTPTLARQLRRHHSKTMALSS